VIADIHLQDTGKEELLKILPTLSKVAPVVVVTGKGSPGTAAELIDAGACGYVAKTFPEFHERLLSQVVACLSLNALAKAFQREPRKNELLHA